MQVTWGRRLHDVEADGFEAQVKKVAGDGFRSIQLAPTKSLQFTQEMLSPGYARYIRRILDQNGLVVAVLGSYFDLSASEEEADLVIQRYKDHMQLAKWAGFSVVGTETGKIFPDDPDYEERFQNVIRNLEPILEYAKTLGLSFAIEPVYGHTIYNAQKMLEVLDHYPTEHLRVIYDPVNLLDPNDEEGALEMWEDFIRKLGHLFVAVHVKDYDIENGKKVDRAAGFGRMAYTHLERLAKQKPHLDFLIETAKDENIKQIREQFKI